MPSIEEVDDDQIDVVEEERDLDDLLNQLAIPQEYNRPDHLSENASAELDAWKRRTISLLNDIRRILRWKATKVPGAKARDVAVAVVPFAPISVGEEFANGVRFEDGWLADGAESVAQEILSLPQLQPTPEFVKEVLEYNLKPIFKASPHPHLNLETGRKLGSYAGGPMAMQDYYDTQVWKKYPGIWRVILWCVSQTPKEAYESMWHLIIPPMMTLLDDYEARHKLEGVFVVHAMLQNVPKDVVKRTGIAGLIQQSLRTSLSHLQSRETPDLVKHAISTSMSLTLLTTSVGPGTKVPPERFGELSSLLGEGIISGIWLYAEDKAEVVHATLDALPSLLEALDIGSVRFLKALIPQLAHTLIPQPLVAPNRELQTSALRVLRTLLKVCRPRIPYWKEVILDAVARCWVGINDEERKGLSEIPGDAKLRNIVKVQLQAICVELGEICPSLYENEYPRFLEADQDLFNTLIPLRK